VYHLASGRGKDAMDADEVLPPFAGIAGIADQAWPTELAELPVQMHVAVQAAKADSEEPR